MQFNESGFRSWPNDYANSTALDAHKRVVLDSNGNLAYAGATQVGRGTLEVSTTATDQNGTVRLWNKPGTRFAIAAGAIAVGAAVFAAAGGKVASTGSIKIGENVGAAASADGDLIEILPDSGVGAVELAVAVAASTAVSNVAVATALDNATYTFPANSLKVGDVIRVRLGVIATATNSTDTLTVTLKIGSTTICATAAVDVADNDCAFIDVDLVIRTIGASGTIVGAGLATIKTTATARILNSTAIDTTAAQTITATATWSVASSSNSCRCDVFNVQHLPRIAA